MYVAQRKIKTLWSHSLAYAIGLLASDGSLSADKRHIYFVSVDLEMVENLKKALGISNKIFRHHRGGEKEKKYYAINFGDVIFYKFLNSIGLTSAKSKTIKKVDVPAAYFPDFLRGLFDGDGTFYTFWDKRWPSSFGYQISFASASPKFIIWLKMMLSRQYKVKGFIRRGDGVFNLRYVKGDSEILFRGMYPSGKRKFLFLRRKYNTIKLALEENARKKNKPR